MSWPKVKLKTLLSKPVQNGYSPVCLEEPSGKWVLGLGALSDFWLDTTQIKPAPIDDGKVDNFLLRPGDFLVSRSNTRDKVGRSALFKGEIKNCSYPDLMMRFRVNENAIYPEFLEMYLRSHEAIKWFQRSASGTSGSMVKINKHIVENLQVPLPSLPEQTAIADLLSTWDEVIEKTERLIQVKERRFKWLLSALLSGHMRSGKTSTWTETTLKEICTIEKGMQKNRDSLSANGAYPVVNGGVSPSGYTDTWNTDANTVTISEGGNSCGFVSFMETPFWCGGHCYALKNLDAKTMNPRFLFFYLKRHEKRIMRLRVGSGLPNIQRRDIEKFPVSYPRLEEQQRITLILSSAQQEIRLLQQMAKKYKDQKRGLMQKLLAGQWRILTDMENKQCV